MQKKFVFVVIFSMILMACSPIPVTGAKITATKALASPTVVLWTNTPPDIPSPTAVNSSDPYPAAPLCQDHSGSTFHTLWDYENGCHFDHEHGTNPFTPEVAAAFPGFDLFALLGNVGIGHTNPSGPMENTHKHGGFKWDVMLVNPHGCLAGFENAVYCVQSAVIQYHNFGKYSDEMETRIHSTAALLKVCNPASPADCGILYTVQHQEYGQRVTPYQGTVITYPDNPSPGYGAGFGPYFTIDCVGPVSQCRSSLDFIRSRNLNVNSIWTSKPTGSGTRPPGSSLFRLLFRVRDVPQVYDWNDPVYPFTFRFICGNTAYNPAGCRWNNSTSKVHEVGGIIPAAWDNLSGFDTNPVAGRITAEGFTDRFGTINLECSEPGPECFPVKLENMFVGYYGDYLTAAKVSGTSPASNPERDIYFCGGVVCSETSSGAVPSGWINENN